MRYGKKRLIKYGGNVRSKNYFVVFNGVNNNAHNNNINK